MSETEKGFNKVKYNNEYNRESYDRFSLMLPKGKKDIIRQAAEKHGESINTFINRIIDAELTRLSGGGFGISLSDFADN